MSTPNERRKALTEAFRQLTEMDQTALIELAQSWARLNGKQRASPKLKTYPANVNGKVVRVTIPED